MWEAVPQPFVTAPSAESWAGVFRDVSLFGLSDAFPGVDRGSESLAGAALGGCRVPARLVQGPRGAYMTIAQQAPLSKGFSRQEYWSGLPLPPRGIFQTQGSNSCLLHW